MQLADCLWDRGECLVGLLLVWERGCVNWVLNVSNFDSVVLLNSFGVVVDCCRSFAQFGHQIQFHLTVSVGSMTS